MTRVPLGERHHVPWVLAPGHQTVRDVCTHRPVGAHHGTKRFTAVRLIYLTIVDQPLIDAAAPGVPGTGMPGTGRVPQPKPAAPRGRGASSATSSQAHVSSRRSPLIQGEDDRGTRQVCEPLQCVGTDRGQRDILEAAGCHPFVPSEGGVWML
jgi:hypothetical protein